MIRSKIVKIIKPSICWLSCFPESPILLQFIGAPIYRFRRIKRLFDPINPSNIKKILLIRLDNIGDVVLTTPFLRELRKIFTDARITLIVSQVSYPLMEECPYIDELLVFDVQGKKYLAPMQRLIRAFFLSIRHLWHRHYDLCILPRLNIDEKTGMTLAYLSCPLRIVGFSENIIKTKRNTVGHFDRLLTHVVHSVDSKHDVEHNLDILLAIGCKVESNILELWTTIEDEIFARDVLSRNNFCDHDRLIAFSPGASEKSKQWPICNFIELGEWIIQTYNARILIIGNKAEQELGSILNDNLLNAAINVAGKTTLRQTLALLKHCNLYIGNDTGPKHMAAAAKVPIIEISRFPLHGPTMHSHSTVRFGPWGVPHYILQPSDITYPCSVVCSASVAHCIKAVTVNPVKNAASQLLF